jgi:hypothetical protein
MLMAPVREYGAKKWAHIAQYLPGRRGKQCRERWRNQLDPQIRKGSFDKSEDAIIVTLQACMGNRWAEIRKYVVGRTDNAIKYRYNSTLSKVVADRLKKNKSIDDYLLSESDLADLTASASRTGMPSYSKGELQQRVAQGVTSPAASPRLMYAEAITAESISSSSPRTQPDQFPLEQCKKFKTQYSVRCSYGFCGGGCRDETRIERK